MSDIKNLVINNESYNIIDDEAVHFTEQNLTELEKKQARDNINAAKTITYVSEETLTGDTWIDGKPIYRQVLQINGSSTNAEQLSIPLGNFKLGFLIRMEGGFFTGEDFCVLPPAHNSSSTGNVDTRIRYATPAPEIRIVGGSARSIDSGYAILEYTKAD